MRGVAAIGTMAAMLGATGSEGADTTDARVSGGRRFTASPALTSPDVLMGVVSGDSESPSRLALARVARVGTDAEVRLRSRGVPTDTQRRGRPMIADWIYNSPTWLWGGILVAVFTAAACGGLLVFHHLVGLDVRQAHNDLAGFTLAVVGVVYAVLLAFIAIATWEAFSKADEIVENESDFAGDIYLDTQGLPGASGQAIRNDIAEYVRTVIEEEWPTQRAGKTPEQGWKPLRDLNSAIATLHPQTPGEAVIEAELLKTWDEL